MLGVSVVFEQTGKTVQKLTSYEEKQVQAIAAWKAEMPSYLGSAFSVVRRPLRGLVGVTVHRSMIDTMLNGLDKHIDTGHDAQRVMKRAGVSDIADLYDKPLEVCDRLAERFSVRAECKAMLQGFAAGIGGIVTEIAALPLMLRASLHAVVRIGHCYGFKLESPEDHKYVLGIMELATVDEPEKRQALRQRLYELVEMKQRSRRRKPVEDIGMLGVEENLVEDMAIEAVPLIGDFASFILNNTETHRLDVTARRVFQERWLRAHGKVKRIPPSSEPKRHSVGKDIVYLGREMIYVGAYGSGFVTTLPVAAIGAVGAKVLPEPVVKGARDGAVAGARDGQAAHDRVFARWCQQQTEADLMIASEAVPS